MIFIDCIPWWKMTCVILQKPRQEVVCANQEPLLCLVTWCTVSCSTSTSGTSGFPSSQDWSVLVFFLISLLLVFLSLSFIISRTLSFCFSCWFYLFLCVLFSLTFFSHTYKHSVYMQMHKQHTRTHSHTATHYLVTTLPKPGVYITGSSLTNNNVCINVTVQWVDQKCVPSGGGFENMKTTELYWRASTSCHGSPTIYLTIIFGSWFAAVQSSPCNVKR